MARYEYLSNPSMLNYIDNLRQKTEFVRIIILNRQDLPLRAIEGRATAGSININADSAVRRTGSLTLVTDLANNSFDPLDIMNQVTDIDTLISINKRIEIEVGIKNTGLKYTDYQIFWIPLGIYVISNASVAYNNGGISISLKLSDKMALLNGDEGGTIPAAVTLSPYTNPITNTTEEILVHDLIKTVLLSFSELLEEQISITDVPKEIPQPVVWSPVDKVVEIYKDGAFQSESGVGIMLQELPTNVDIIEFIEGNTTKIEQQMQKSAYWVLPKNPGIVLEDGEKIFQFKFKAMVQNEMREYSSLTFNYSEEYERYSIYYGNDAVWLSGKGGGWQSTRSAEIRSIFVEKEETIPLELLEWLHTYAIGDYHILLWNNPELDFVDFSSASGALPDPTGVRTENFVYKKVTKEDDGTYDYYAQYGITIDLDNKTITYIESSQDAYVKIVDGDVQLTAQKPEQDTSDSVFIAPGARTGYLTIPFVYPGGELLSAQAGDTVVTVLDKIKSALGGNFEYFFDIDGIFHFQEIKNYLNEGSGIDDLTKAINEKYFITTNKGRAVYNFKNANLISSYNNNPQYLQIKNDFNVYGQNTQTKEPIRYHLLLQKLPTSEEMKYWEVKWDEETFEYIIAVDAICYESIEELLENKHAEYNQYELSYEDWRIKYYFDAVRKHNSNKRLNNFEEEVYANIPLILNFDSSEGKEIGVFKDNPQNLSYFLDAVDTNSVELMDQVLVKDFGIESIGRRTKVINDNNLNCMFATPIPNAYLDNADNNVKKQIQLMPSTEKPLYEALRKVIHEHLSYNNNINITSLPVYRLDANMRIKVDNNESDIHGDYVIKSISLPLGVSGNMTINARKAIEKI